MILSWPCAVRCLFRSINEPMRERGIQGREIWGPGSVDSFGAPVSLLRAGIRIETITTVMSAILAIAMSSLLALTW